MAFQKTQVEGFQTATNGAVTLTAALLSNGLIEQDAVVQTVKSLRDELFGDIADVIAKDNEMLRAEAASSPSTTPSNRRSTSADEPKATKTFSKEEGAAITLNFGAFKGKSIGDVIAMPASEAGTYGYPKAAPGTKPGKSYIEWLANDDEPARSFASNAAKAALA
jgi:ribosomal protein L12E/L44/L45/RPP1/RPP2